VRETTLTLAAAPAPAPPFRRPPAPVAVAVAVVMEVVGTAKARCNSPRSQAKSSTASAGAPTVKRFLLATDSSCTNSWGLYWVVGCRRDKGMHVTRRGMGKGGLGWIYMCGGERVTGTNVARSSTGGQ